MDKAFEGLLFSLALHAIIWWLYLHAPQPPPHAISAPTEVTFIDAPAKTKDKTKSKLFVEETETKPEDIKTLADAADFLSQFTKRVKKQVRARQNGPTRNSTPQVIQTESKGKNEGQRSGVAGMADEPPQRDRTKGDIGLPPRGGNQGMRQVAIGPSSIAEFIPGVEEGDFTALNTDQFTYYSFFARINEQVRNRWVAGIRNYMSRLTQFDLDALGKMNRDTVVEIILTKTGEFSSSVISHSSGVRVLDQTTVEAFRDAAPFLNPPQGMITSDGMIHLHYGFTLRFRPPLGQAGY